MNLRILIVRHADPDYENDTLTEKGWREAHLLADYLERFPVTAAYCSPLGRAQDTASVTLKRKELTATTLDWLHEFRAFITKPDRPDELSETWDWVPEDWVDVPEYYSPAAWTEIGIMQREHVREKYDAVCEALDEVLAKHGYVREGNLYRVEKANTDTIIFFCHFGIECVLLSHLLDISPMQLWHHTCAAPASVTSIYTEERRPGKVIFRMNFFGSTAHLELFGEEASFSARYCEYYGKPGERTDP